MLTAIAHLKQQKGWR